MTSLSDWFASPAAGFDEPFAMLAACHERVARMLRLLERLDTHVAAHGADAQAARAADDIVRYFDRAGPAHHEDEARHVFPALRATGEAPLVALVARLEAEHVAMADAWAVLRPDLVALGEGRVPGVQDSPRPAWRHFAALYRAHIALEEGEAFPAAAARLGEAAVQAMGEEMAARRGVRRPAGAG